MDCTTYFIEPIFAPLYKAIVPYPQNVSNPFITGSTTFKSVNSTLCPITSVELFKNGLPFNSTCAEVGVNGVDINYKGTQFCKETDLKVKIRTTGGDGSYFLMSSAIFDVEIRIDCAAHLVLPDPMPNFVYTNLEPVSHQFYNGSSIKTNMPVECPLKLQIQNA